MKKKYFSIAAALFVSVIAAYAFPVRFTCEDGSEHMGYAQTIEDAIEMANDVCEALAEEPAESAESVGSEI